MRTTQSSQGYLPAGGAPVLLTAEHAYSDLAPSLKLVAEVTLDLVPSFH